MDVCWVMKGCSVVQMNPYGDPPREKKEFVFLLEKFEMNHMHVKMSGYKHFKVMSFF